MAPSEDTACLSVSMPFVRGKCLMSVGTMLNFKVRVEAGAAGISQACYGCRLRSRRGHMHPGK